VLLLYTLPFGFWFIMMYLGFIPRDDAIQEVTTITVVLLKTGGCTYALLSDVWAPTLQKLCGTQDCHVLKNRPNID
jgi:hypothetical protein